MNGEEQESYHDKDLEKAMQLTGGYVNYLRENVNDLLAQIKIDKADLYTITRLAKFVALMRARPSETQKENTERELAARLVSQLLKLTKMMAVVMNAKGMNEEVMRRVTEVARVTGRGISFDLCNYIYKGGNKGREVTALSLEISQTDETTRKFLRFLKSINVVEQTSKKSTKVRAKKVWRRS